MVTLIIDERSRQAQQFLNYARTLSFTTVVEEGTKEKNFQKAVSDCEGVSADAFFDELDNRLKKHYRNA